MAARYHTGAPRGVPPTTIIAAADDPVGPVEQLHAVPAGRGPAVEVPPCGGHCGCVSDLALRAWSEPRIRDLLRDAPAAAGAGAT